MTTKLITVIADAVSLRKKDSKGNPYLYAKRGDKVRLISDRDNVLIVEDKAGHRFPIRKDKTDYENVH